MPRPTRKQLLWRRLQEHGKNPYRNAIQLRLKPELEKLREMHRQGSAITMIEINVAAKKVGADPNLVKDLLAIEGIEI